MKDFTYETKYTPARADGETAKATISIEGPGTADLIRVLEGTAVEIMDGQVATGREIIDFLTTFNGGHSRVENDAMLLQALDGSWLLKLDELYTLATFGTITAGEETFNFADALLAWRRAHRQQDPRRKGPRYPYTHAYDLVRMLGPQEQTTETLFGTPLLSRTHAALLVKALAPALRVEAHELAEMLADYYLAHEEELVELSVRRITGSTP